ncbi:MAG: ABC transporter permease [Fimbriimonadaceae bacterium]
MNPTLVVFKKELRDMFRDKRVRSAAFVMPILIIIGLLYLLGSVISSLGKPQNIKVHVVQANHPLVATLKAKQFNVIPVSSVEEGKRLVQKGDAKVVLDFSSLPASPDQQIVVSAYFDRKEQTAQIALGKVEEALAEKNKEMVAAYLKTNDIDPAALELIKVKREIVQVGSEGGAGEMVVGLLPYLIVIWAFYGGMGIVGDLVAGEKEKNTLETLLITPVRRTQIVLGKFYALSIVCLLSSVSSIIGLAIYAVLKPPGSSDLLKGGLGLNPATIGIVLLILLPMVALFAGLLIAVSSFAKNTREASTQLSVLSFIVIMPAIFVQFLGLTDLGKQMWINFVPILNAGANIRAAFLGKAELAPVLVTVAVSLVIALAALKVAVWLFNREQVLTRV